MLNLKTKPAFSSWDCLKPQITCQKSRCLENKVPFKFHWRKCNFACYSRKRKILLATAEKEEFIGYSREHNILLAIAASVLAAAVNVRVFG